MSKWTHVHFVEIEVMKTRDSGKKSGDPEKRPR